MATLPPIVLAVGSITEEAKQSITEQGGSAHTVFLSGEHANYTIQIVTLPSESDIMPSYRRNYSYDVYFPARTMSEPATPTIEYFVDQHHSILASRIDLWRERVH